ncbi:MAG TPA: hypothetical protein VHE99_07785 [Gammaproteobacteria bacterium]|nr:hypothetical protein [Gammaproteobacteria bacterium]
MALQDSGELKQKLFDAKQSLLNKINLGKRRSGDIFAEKGIIWWFTHLIDKEIKKLEDKKDFGLKYRLLMETKEKRTQGNYFYLAPGLEGLINFKKLSSPEYKNGQKMEKRLKELETALAEWGTYTNKFRILRLASSSSQRSEIKSRDINFFNSSSSSSSSLQVSSSLPSASSSSGSLQEKKNDKLSILATFSRGGDDNWCSRKSEA